ncbi:MAG: sporulation protein [Gemmatimonadetes bacterium]|jgi:uncharacterized spore protein YtfJ|nr:sporulation protein [Gemmatimonadota bacterium]|tara:strand:+ start:518 stop:910 length:393 start_codon:yes stop_codon:yes gene_type:complete
MTSSVETLIERVLGELHRIVQTETVIGTPVQAGELTIIPVSKISFGFGAGGGQAGTGQSGTGGGASVEPIAFLIVDASGKVQIMTLTDKEVGWGQIAALVPEAVDKIKQFVGKKDGAKENAAEAADEATQ